MAKKPLSIIIPAYNEEYTIHRIPGKEPMIVNDGPGTVQAVERYMATHPGMGTRLHQQPRNMGKGAAIHRGIAAATGDHLLVQDASLGYDPCGYNDLLRPVVEGDMAEMTV